VIALTGRLHVFALAALLAFAPALPAICDAWCSGASPVAAEARHATHHHGATDPAPAAAQAFAVHHHHDSTASAVSPVAHVMSLPSTDCDDLILQIGPPPFSQKVSLELKMAPWSSNAAAALTWPASPTGAGAPQLQADVAHPPATRNTIPLRI
jgi:hypothetical protein